MPMLCAVIRFTLLPSVTVSAPFPVVSAYLLLLPGREWHIEISLSVSLSVCLSVCPPAYLWNRCTDLHEIGCADPL